MGVASQPPHPILFLTMPFDTVVLNDGTNVRPLSYSPCSLSYREPTVSGPCVRNRIQVERDCKLRDFLVALVALLMSCPPCDRRTLQNTWSRPSTRVSSTSTQPPVTCSSVIPAGQWTQSQFSDYENEESVGAGLKQSGLARLPAIFGPVSGADYSKTDPTFTSPPNMARETYESPL